MTRVFIRGEDDCGRGKFSAQDYINQFKVPVLFGRSEEISQLNHAWVDSKINLLLLNAPIGMGKTTLVEKWLYTLQKANWHDAESVYFWTFYPPGITETLRNPVDEFFEQALTWFGAETDKCPSFLQGECLAQHIRTQHTLLVLDGLENLQAQQGSLKGQITDPRLQLLLARLREDNPGLCLVVSRHAFNEQLQGEYTQTMQLAPLPEKDCLQLLRFKGIQASDKKLLQLAVDFEQLPLTLTLLGGYLNIWHGGDWRQMEKIPVLMDQNPEGRQARRLLVANSFALRDQAGESLLYLLSLLCRPIHIETINALTGKKPKWPIRLWGKRPDSLAELMRPLLRLNTQQLQHLIRQLQELGLLAGKGRCLLAPQWVRDAFQRQFKHDWPQAWKQANQQLMQFYDELPHTTPQQLPAPQTVFVAEPTPVVLSEAETATHTTPKPSITATKPEPEVATPKLAPVLSTPPLQAETAPAEPKAVQQANTRISPASSNKVSSDQPAANEPVDVLPLMQDKDLQQLEDLSTQLQQFHNSMQRLQIRTRKFHKQLKQLDKEVESMQYPQAKTGTDN